MRPRQRPRARARRRHHGDAGETAAVVAFVLWTAFCIIVMIAVIVVAIHFIAKLW